MKTAKEIFVGLIILVLFYFAFVDKKTPVPSNNDNPKILRELVVLQKQNDSLLKERDKIPPLIQNTYEQYKDQSTQIINNPSDSFQYRILIQSIRLHKELDSLEGFHSIGGYLD